MPTCQAKDFEVTILGDQSPYNVVVNYQDSRGLGVFHHDALHADWQERLRVLAAPHVPPGESQILQIGGLLFDGLMQGGIRDLWVQARTDLEIGGILRVRLNLHPPAVAALPWETLADPRRHSTLAADKSIALVRTATEVDYLPRPRSIFTQLPARILIVAVEEDDNINLAAELTRIQSSLAPLVPNHLHVEIIQGRFDLESLRDRLQEDRPDILHVVSHGETDGIYLWEKGRLALIKASQWAAMLGLVDSVKLVFLNACLAGQPDSTTPFASLAQRLLQVGIPAVIAMQFEVLDRAAATFAGSLYNALVAGPCPGAVDVAVSVARSNLYINSPDRIDYATPLLWLNGPNGIILQWADNPAQAADAPLSLARPDPAPPRLDLGIAEKDAWFARLPASIGPVALRFDYSERKNLVEKALNLLRQDEEAQSTGLTLDLERANQRLDIFNTERRFIDRLLERLNNAEQ